MKWYEGSISDAVATSKSRKAIFVVFVEGKDDASVQVAQAIDTPDVSGRLEQDDFVAVRLEGGSEAYQFFAQIYKLVPVPSIFFIGENGAPLQIVAGGISAQDLCKKIDAALAKAGKTSQNASLDLINAEQQATVSSSLENASLKEIAKDEAAKPNTESTTDTKLQATVSKDDSTSPNVTKTDEPVPMKNAEPTPRASSNEDSPTKNLSAEEKVERAKQLIELQRKQRVEEEEKKDREREVERRKLGRDVQKMRQRQQELEIKQAHDERMKEKAAETAAKERVRRQIEQDKLERKQKELALQQQEKQKKQDQAALQPSVPNDATITRVQFRLPTGNPYTAQFEPTSTLGALRTYVIQNIELPFQQFSMCTSFPRRDLTHEDDNKTLLQLELVPTAVILILPVKNSTAPSAIRSSQDVGFLSRFIWSLFAPIIGVYNYIASYFSWGSRRNSTGQRRDTGGARPVNNPDEPVSPNLQNLANSSLVRRYLGNQGGTKIRADGNIHRLHSGGDDNDENNTWNGNSTQQM